MELQFNDLPKAVTSLQETVNSIQKLLLERNNEPQQETDELLTVPDAAKFLRLSVPTVYSLISKGELPVMKRSKRCYFSKIELIAYLKAGRKRTISETGSEAEAYLKKKGRS